MMKTAQYAYLNTKTRILGRQLFSPSDWEHMASLPLEGLIEYLKGHGIDTILDMLKHNNYHLLPAGNMDHLFIRQLLSEARQLLRCLGGPAREMLKTWLMRFELQNLKTIIRGKSLQHPSHEIQQVLLSLGSDQHLPLDELLQAVDISEILILLERSTYAAIARYIQHQYDAKSDIFSLEAAINLRYYQLLQQRLQQLDREEQKPLLQLHGLIIDQLNVLWILRYRLYYNMSASHVFYLMASGGHYLLPEQLSQLCTIEDISQLGAKLPPALAKNFEQCTSLQETERQFDYLIIQQARRILSQNPFSVAPAFAYLSLREKQLGHCHALLKGRLMQLPASHFMDNYAML